MGYNTTKKVCVGLGQTDEEGKKFAKFDDVVSKVEEALKTPDSQGTYADYVELLKLYDKNQNGTMLYSTYNTYLAVTTNHKKQTLGFVSKAATSIKTLNAEIQRYNTNGFLVAHLETLPVDNAWSGLIVLLLGDPHLLESRERSQDGATNPYGVFPLWRSNNLNFHS